MNTYINTDDRDDRRRLDEYLSNPDQSNSAGLSKLDRLILRNSKGLCAVWDAEALATVLRHRNPHSSTSLTSSRRSVASPEHHG